MIRRLNKDFEMQWNPSDFEHYATYNPQNLSMEPYLVSRKEQKFKTVILAANEMIHTEMSRKYRLKDMQSMAESTLGSSGLQIFWILNNFLWTLFGRPDNIIFRKPYNAATLINPWIPKVRI